jgi:hypothetical protein
LHCMLNMAGSRKWIKPTYDPDEPGVSLDRTSRGPVPSRNVLRAVGGGGIRHMMLITKAAADRVMTLTPSFDGFADELAAS